MARERIKLSWEATGGGPRGRYRKMLRGHRFTSSVYDSNSRRNRSDAWAEFLAWRRELDEKDNAATEETVDERSLRESVEKIAAIARLAERSGDTAFAVKWKQLAAEAAADEVVGSVALFESFEELASDAWNAERRQGIATADLSAERVVAEYLEGIRRQVDAKQRSVGLYGQTRSALTQFLDWFGKTTSMETLGERHVQEYHAYLLGKIGTLSQTTVSSYLKLWKTFVDESAADIPEISVPSNLRSRRYVVKAANPQIVTFETAEVTTILEQASDRMELYLLLMLNCGMTQQDIADLQASEVDFEAGRIIRRRSKEANAPLVNWLLWDRTAEMLADQGHQKGNVLRKVDGGSLVESGIHEDGREFRRDAIVSNWRHLITKCKRRKLLADDWHKTLKDFRKTSATVIERSPDAEFVDMFLDHSRVARQHYLKGQIVPKFDRAVVWLGDEFGLATSSNRASSTT